MISFRRYESLKVKAQVPFKAQPTSFRVKWAFELEVGQETFAHGG